MKTDLLKKSAKAHTTYINNAGVKVPGVTTILGVLNKPALVKWANNLGLQGIDSSKYRDKAASIGTLAHLMVQNYLQNTEGDYSAFSDDDISLAENSLLSFYEWLKNNNLEPLFQEKAFISEKYQYGGTIDCYGILNGKYTLLDFKTSSGIWPEMLHQVAGGYYQLLKEAGLEVEQIRILRIGRSEDEGFEDRVVTNWNLHWGIFESALKIYNYQNLLKKVV
jgi:hypothetical protein